jgi:hypothetical protein
VQVILFQKYYTRRPNGGEWSSSVLCCLSQSGCGGEERNQNIPNKMKLWPITITVNNLCWHSIVLQLAVLKFPYILVLEMLKFMACGFHSNLQITASASGKTESFLFNLHQLSENMKCDWCN